MGVEDFSLVGNEIVTRAVRVCSISGIRNPGIWDLGSRTQHPACYFLNPEPFVWVPVGFCE